MTRYPGVLAAGLGLLVSLALAGAAAAAAHVAPATRAVMHHGLLVNRLRGVHDARQVITVTSRNDDTQHATVQAFAKTSAGWRRVAGPWSAWIGTGGFAPTGEKREGDGRTPSGSYPFSFFFGAAPEPAVHYPWRHAASYDYWDDDSSSPRYNQWVDSRRHSAGRDPEPLHVHPSYDDVAVIDYNPADTPGRGSAIFLHVTHHSATSGCVALPRSELLQLLRWLRPSDHARIVMGSTATVTR